MGKIERSMRAHAELKHEIVVQRFTNFQSWVVLQEESKETCFTASFGPAAVVRPFNCKTFLHRAKLQTHHYFHLTLKKGKDKTKDWNW